MIPNEEVVGSPTIINSRASSNNFGGTDSELLCEGGEVAFVKRIIVESKRYWESLSVVLIAGISNEQFDRD